jgi:uncharacterized membrane protein YdjX (TVP38/TMEM64 family)
MLSSIASRGWYMDIDKSFTKLDTRTLRNLLLIVLGVLLLALFVSRRMEQVRQFIRAGGWWGILFSLILYGILGASPIPSEPLTVFISTVYGPLPATLIAGTGNLLAALVEFFIGVKVGDVANFEERKSRLPLGLGKMAVDSPIFLIGARMLPGYGPKFVSLIAGIYRVPLWRYTWTSAFSTLLGAAAFAYGGSQLVNLW